MGDETVKSRRGKAGREGAQPLLWKLQKRALGGNFRMGSEIRKLGSCCLTFFPVLI